MYYIKNRAFDNLCLVEEYESLIWTDRYDCAGDFELMLPLTNEAVQYAVIDNYLYSTESEHTMIIETVDLTYDTDRGYMVKVSGRSLESILDRRIVWKTYKNTGEKYLLIVIEELLQDNLMEYSPRRTDEHIIENFTIHRSTNPEVYEIKIDSIQFTGDNLYEVIVSLCRAYGLGFKITLDLNDINYGKFVFEVYKGTTRTGYTDVAIMERGSDFRNKNVYDPPASYDDNYVIGSTPSNPDEPIPEAYFHLDAIYDANIAKQKKTQSYLNRSCNLYTSDRLLWTDQIYDEYSQNISFAVTPSQDVVGYSMWFGEYNSPNIKELIPNHYAEGARLFSTPLKAGHTYTFHVKMFYYFGFKMCWQYNNAAGAYFTSIVSEEIDETAVYVPVMFSEEYKNLASLEYLNSKAAYKTIAKIDGAGEGELRFTTEYMTENAHGLDRREMYVDARDISENDQDGNPLSADEYTKLLLERGREKLEQVQQTTSLTCEIDPDVEWKFGKDYYLGDIIKIESQLGVSENAIVTEMVFSDDVDGRRVFPGLELI